MYTLLYLERQFFNLTFESMICFSQSLLPRSVETTPMRLRLEIEIKRHCKCIRLTLTTKMDCSTTNLSSKASGCMLTKFARATQQVYIYNQLELTSTEHSPGSANIV